MQTIESNNIVWQEGDYFVAQCLNPGVSSFGATKEEALRNLKEAVELIGKATPYQKLSTNNKLSPERLLFQKI